MTSSATFVVVSVTSKQSAPYATSSSKRMMDGSRSSEKDNKIAHANSTNEAVEAGQVPCGARTTNQPLMATLTAAPGGANRLTATLTLLKPGLRRFRESIAISIFRMRTISRDAPSSPSQQWRYILWRQLQRSKATIRKLGHSVHCQRRVLGH